MVTFDAVYSKTAYKDESTGFTGFYVDSKNKDAYGIVFCVGIIPPYDVGTPLTICGEKDKDKINVKEIKINKFSFPRQLLFSIKGLGEEKIKKIGEIINDEDIFSFAKRKDAKEKLKCIGEKEASKVIDKVNSLYELQDLLTLIFSVDGSYNTAISFFKDHGQESIVKITENPYLLFDHGLSFEKCERLNKNIDILDDKRLHCLLKAIFKYGQSAGHCYLTLPLIFKIQTFIEKNFKTEPFFLAAQILKEKKNYVIENEKIYKTSDLLLEKKAAENIRKILKKKKYFPYEKIDINRIEEECGILFDYAQKEAFNLLKSSGVKMLTGGPGTGKTATMKGIVAGFREMMPNATISLCAPTANAAKRLRESTNENALTVHKLLNVKPFGEDVDYIKDLQSDLVIVDEASMIDINLLKILSDAVKDDVLLLFVGDEDQLPSVGNGNVFHDLLDCEKIEKIRLKTIHRQDKDCSIIANSIAIKEGRDDLTEDVHTQIIKTTADNFTDTVLEEIQKYYIKEQPWKTKVYTPIKNQKYMVSTRVLNRKLHAIYNPTSGFIRGRKIFSKGDPIIMTRNNYESGYCNGDEGVVEEIVDKKLLINIDGNILEISGSDLDDIELAYAITTHKSQGSECDTAIIVVPLKPSSMLTRNLIYVAATRARKKNVFIVEENALSLAVKQNKSYKRLTALKERIEA